MNEETLQMLGQLNDIGDSVEGLKISVQRACEDDEVVRESLAYIWSVTQDLERRLARPEIVAGFRVDAVEQIERVHQLIGEARDQAIDERQLISIGFSCELAAEKIRKYIRVAKDTARVGGAVTARATMEE